MFLTQERAVYMRILLLELKILPINTPTQPRSSFARMLASDPVLAARCKAVANQVRASAREDIEAGRRAEQIGPADLATYINARA